MLEMYRNTRMNFGLNLKLQILYIYFFDFLKTGGKGLPPPHGTCQIYNCMLTCQIFKVDLSDIYVILSKLNVACRLEEKYHHAYMTSNSIFSH